MHKDSQETLDLFVEKARKLLRSRFFTQIQAEGYGVNLSVTAGGPVELDARLPDEEALDALNLTLRFFIQDNERISLRRLQTILDDPCISQEWKDQYTAARDWLNTRLDAPHDQIKVNDMSGNPATSRYIFETFVYGEIAHASKEKRRQYQQWTNNPILFHFIRLVFHNAVTDILGVIAFIASITEMELAGQAIPPVNTASEP